MTFYSYIYFYPLSQSREIPLLLSQSIKRAASISKKVIIAGPSEYKNEIYNLGSNILFFEIHGESLQSPLIKQYVQLVDDGIIKSNHPPTEIHCINRWLFLDKLFKSNRLPIDINIISVDWDCLLFNPFKDVLSRIEFLLARFNSFYGSYAPFLASHVIDAIHNQRNDLPVFNICPSILLANAYTIDLYRHYLSSYLLSLMSGNKPNLNRLFSRKFFSDMIPWSSVFSHICLNNPDLFFDIGIISTEIDIFVDHNIRVSRQNSVLYEMERHSIPPEYDYESSDGYVSLKKVDYVGGTPFVSSLSKQTRVGALHFCGVESKYVLLNSGLRSLLL